MKKFLVITAVLAALTLSVQAQYKESAVTGPSGGLVMGVEEQSIRWSVTGNPTDVIWVGLPMRTGIYFQRFVNLGAAQPGLLKGDYRQLVVERVERLANNQIRVSLRHDPLKVTVLPGGEIRRTYQGELIHGQVQLRTASGAIIDSDPVMPSPFGVY